MRFVKKACLISMTGIRPPWYICTRHASKNVHFHTFTFLSFFFVRTISKSEREGVDKIKKDIGHFCSEEWSRFLEYRGSVRNENTAFPHPVRYDPDPHQALCRTSFRCATRGFLRARRKQWRIPYENASIFVGNTLFLSAAVIHRIALPRWNQFPFYS